MKIHVHQLLTLNQEGLKQDMCEAIMGKCMLPLLIFILILCFKVVAFTDRNGYSIVRIDLYVLKSNTAC